VHLNDLCDAFAVGGCSEEDLTRAKALIERKEYGECLSRFEGYVRSMPFLNIDEVSVICSECWDLISTWYQYERKSLQKKIRTMELDSKANPDTLEKLEINLGELDKKKARALVETLRCRLSSVPLKEYIDNPEFDLKAYMKELKDKGWDLARIAGATRAQSAGGGK
jgi:hypothetical protein